MTLKHFPIGVQDFEWLRVSGKYYVDKTALIYKLAHTDEYYFLARPRRFGKSLLLSTLQCYFEGRKDLFEGLAMESLENEWAKHMVFNLSFAGNKYLSKRDLFDTLHKKLGDFERKVGMPVSDSEAWGVRMESLLEAAYAKSGRKVVILIDEYDSPLLDTMGDADLQMEIKQELSRLFCPLKDKGNLIRFLLIAGIGKFNLSNIFGGMNNLNDITMHKDYVDLCGVTADELATQMQPEVQTLADANGISYAEACDALRKRYDGYHFRQGSVSVYNPFSLMSALNKRKLDDYWFGTGTPTVLVEMMKRHSVDPEMLKNGFKASLGMFDTPTETAKSPIPMLYQSGYLTIKGYNPKDFTPYLLGLPNEEVANGLFGSLLEHYCPLGVEYPSVIQRICDAFAADDVESVLCELRAFLSAVPYDADKKNELHYKTIVYCVFSLATPYFVRCEEKSAAGRCDVLVETPTSVSAFEFKLDANGTADDAISQIESRGYLIPYTVSLDSDGKLKRLFKVGVEFDSEKRTLGEWKVVDA